MTQGRKPAVYLLVILPVMFGGGFALIAALLNAYKEMHEPSIPTVNGLLITFPAFALWIPLSLLISNVVLYVVPPLRRIAETYASQNNYPGFTDSQTQLGRLAAVFSLVCLPLIALGFYV